jgi:glycosyltransferase involved in cell wall biosynthesis
MKERSIAVLGDVLDVDCFGGAPRQFFEAAKRQSFAHHAWRVDVAKLRLPRLAWNLAQVLHGRRPRGFQYSATCRRRSLEQIPREWWATDVISFQQHFPPVAPIKSAGGSLNLYIDATYQQLFPAYGLDEMLPARVCAEAIEYERQVFEGADRIVASQPWTADSLLNDYRIPAQKCATILPAPNFIVHPGVAPPRAGRAGVDRPVVLGFIGKDWRRKGLRFQLAVAEELQRRGWQARVRAIGFKPDDLDFPCPPSLECLGFIDKARDFGPFLHSCDLGCLFSEAEAAGIAMLEFLAAGIPVAGFAVNGLRYLLPPDAGFRFEKSAPAAEVSDRLDQWLKDESHQRELRENAARWSPLLTWDRCLAEFREFWETGSIKAGVSPSLGLGARGDEKTA